MRIPLQVTAGYGEIRPNHFHSGIDFSTQGKRQDVIAVADGYVSRIKVSAVGYGNAVYVNHPNGFTTVYAHLSRFNDAIDAYIRSVQNAAREYETDVFPDSLEFPLKRGALLGYSGNSGSSTAPHLHFEIRDQFFENTLNPLLFGYAEKDNTAPTLSMLAIIPQKGAGRVNESESLLHVPLVMNKKLKKKMPPAKMKMPVISGWAGFGFVGGDVIGKTSSSTGIYSIRLLVDSVEIFHARFDEFSFDETRCVNAYMNYREKLSLNRKLQQCIVPENNMIGIYKTQVNRGYFYFDEDRKYSIRYELRDIAGNLTVQELKVKGKAPLEEMRDSLQSKPGYFLVNAGTEQHIEIANEIEVDIESESLFETQWIQLKRTGKLNGENVYALGSIYVPINQLVHVRIRPSSVDSAYKEKMLIVRQQGKNNDYLPAQLQNGWVEAATNEFGDFRIMIDSVPPSISRVLPVARYKTIKKGRRRIKVPISDDGPAQAKGTIRFKISDRYSGVASVQAFLNGEWILLEPGDGNEWYYRFPENLEVGCHEMNVRVYDKCGNSEALFLELDKLPVLPEPASN